MSVSRMWDVEMTARSPISHRGDMIGTTALLRRMKIIQPDGSIELVPVISGNSFRGVLRRLGEEMLRDVLHYDGQLPLPVAHTLRNGGSIVRSKAEAITGRRLNELRELIPQLSVFGGAVGSAPISGCLKVGHVTPIVRETVPILRFDYGAELVSCFDVETREAYSHLDDVSTARDVDTPTSNGDGSPLMRYDIETLAPGTRFESWVQLDRGSALDEAFLADVLVEFGRRGWLGGRSGIGHGQVVTAITPDPAENIDLDWRSVVGSRRQEALDALQSLPA
ncbi:hypothetical protein GQ649_32885 [Rhodococcus sp. DSM 6344]|nr:hypothetical protein [Rhodococcus erythropolis]